MRCQALLVEWLSKPEKGSKGAKEVEGTYLGWICSDESPIHNTNTDFWDFSSLPVRHWCRWHRSGDDLQPPAKPSTASHRRQLVAVAPAAGVYVDSVLEQAWEWWRALALRPGLGVCHYPISIVQCPVSMTEYFFLLPSFKFPVLSGALTPDGNPTVQRTQWSIDTMPGVQLCATNHSTEAIGGKRVLSCK